MANDMFFNKDEVAMNYFRACILSLCFIFGADAMDGYDFEQKPRFVSAHARKKKPRRTATVIRWVSADNAQARVAAALTAPTLEKEPSCNKKENLSWAQILARTEAKERKAHQQE